MSKAWVRNYLTGLIALTVILSACSAAATPPAQARHLPSALRAGGRASPGVQEVVVRASEFAFEPAEITVKAGQPVRIILQNDGTLLHDFSSADAQVALATSTGAEHTEHEAGPSSTTLHVAAEAGRQGTLEFTPTAAGTFAFFCSVEGHLAAGMLGKLVVSP